MRTDTTSVRDRLLAALRESGDWMSSAAVGQAAGAHFVAVKHGASIHAADNFHSCTGNLDVLIIGLDKTQNRAHRELVAMEKLGLVTRATQHSPTYRVFWSYVKPSDPDPGPMLEAIWNAPAADRG